MPTSHTLNIHSSALRGSREPVKCNFNHPKTNVIILAIINIISKFVWPYGMAKNPYESHQPMQLVAIWKTKKAKHVSLPQAHDK